MTEIPEHLLKRSAERRAALTGAEAPSDAPAEESAAPAAAASEAPAAEVAPKAPEPLPTLDKEQARPEPVPAVVAAANRRKRVPYWAATVLALLPLWGAIYWSGMQEPPAGEHDPLAIGAEVYTPCAGCHGATGEGGTGQVLAGGEVLLTFPDPLSMAHWIHFGADEGARPDQTYGDPDREGGARHLGDLSATMPSYPDLSAEELAAVVIYIREGLSGGTIEDDPNFNSEVFHDDLAALEASIEEVIALGPGDPDVSGIEGAEGAEGSEG